MPDSLASERLKRAQEDKVQETARSLRVTESIDDLTSVACGFWLTCEQAKTIMLLYGNAWRRPSFTLSHFGRLFQLPRLGRERTSECTCCCVFAHRSLGVQR